MSLILMQMRDVGGLPNKLLGKISMPADALQRGYPLDNFPPLGRRV